jgi:pimeloyl-ACP methyl ester carboxylesterase
MTPSPGVRDLDVTTPDGRVLRVHDSGEPGDTRAPVLRHHGTPESGLLLDEAVTDAASRGLRLIGHDRPGYGGSSRSPGRDVAAVARDTAAVADALGVDRFLVYGESGGGPHALACAALLPDRVRAAASVAGVGPYGADGLDFLAGMGQDNVEEFGAAVDGEPALRELLRPARDGLLGSGVEGLAAEMATLLPPVDVAALDGGMATWLHASMIDGLSGSVDGWLDDDLAFTRSWGFDLAAISVPVLVIQGGQDLMVPVGHAPWLAAAIPGAQLRVDDAHGHISLLAALGDVHAWLIEHWID